MNNSPNTQIIIATIGAIAAIIVALIGRGRVPKQDDESPQQHDLTKRRRNTTFYSLLALGFAATAFVLALFPGRVATLTGTVIPPGTIVAWAKESGPIPPGWAACDGLDKRPDLQGRFLRGVGSLSATGPDTSAPQANHVESGRAVRGDPPDGFQITQGGSPNFKAPGLNHSHDVPLPPHFNIVFIIKL